MGVGKVGIQGGEGVGRWGVVRGGGWGGRGGWCSLRPQWREAGEKKNNSRNLLFIYLFRQTENKNLKLG